MTVEIKFANRNLQICLQILENTQKKPSTTVAISKNWDLLIVK